MLSHFYPHIQFYQSTSQQVIHIIEISGQLMDMTVLLILDLSATCETVSGSFLVEVACASVPVTAPRLARPSHLCQRACYLPVLAGPPQQNPTDRVP